MGGGGIKEVCGYLNQKFAVLLHVFVSCWWGGGGMKEVCGYLNQKFAVLFYVFVCRLLFGLDFCLQRHVDVHT